MNAAHEPDSDFLAHLEWQTRTKVRRNARFDASASARPAGEFRRSLWIVALALFCLLGGGGAVLAAQEFQEHRNRDELLAHNALQIQIENTRREGAATLLERLRASHRQGIVSQSALEEPERLEAQLELTIRKLELDRDEIEASGRAPNNHLDAPVIGEVDFVYKRLEADLLHAAGNRDRMDYTLERARALFESGAIPTRDFQAAAALVEQSESEFELMVELIRLRITFTSRDLSEEECRLHEQVLRTRHDLDIAKGRFKTMQRMRELNSELEATGRQSPGAKPTASDLKAAELELELRQGFLDSLLSRLGETPEFRPLPGDFKGLFRDQR